MNIATDLCNRCLIIVDVRSSVVAHFTDKHVHCPSPTSPLSLASWVEQQGIAGADSFSINDMPYAFVPFSTWLGDPVCAPHLHQLVDRERRQW